MALTALPPLALSNLGFATNWWDKRGKAEWERVVNRNCPSQSLNLNTDHRNTWPMMDAHRISPWLPHKLPTISSWARNFCETKQNPLTIQKTKQRRQPTSCLQDYPVVGNWVMPPKPRIATHSPRARECGLRFSAFSFSSSHHCALCSRTRSPTSLTLKMGIAWLPLYMSQCLIGFHNSNCSIFFFLGYNNNGNERNLYGVYI